MFIDASLNRQDLADVAGGELVEPDITVPQLVGCREEVNSLPPESPTAGGMQEIEDLDFLSPVPPVNLKRSEKMGLADTPSPPCPNARHANRAGCRPIVTR